MKKYKLFLIIFLAIIFCNVAYYVISNWQNLFPNNNSSISETADLKTYNSSKMGFEVKYPASWIVQDDGDTVEMNPLSRGSIIYFSAGLRNDFKSLDDVKSKLASNILLTPIQINNASGFEYNDSASYEAIWLSNAGKVYLIRTYLSPSSPDGGAPKILSTFKFTK